MAGARRKIKRIQRTIAEDKEVLEKIMTTCRRYGLKVDFAWQIPDIFERAMSGQSVAPAIGSTSGHPLGLATPQGHRSPTDALRQLSQGLGAPRMAMLTASPGLPSPIDDEEQIDPSLVQSLFDEFGEEEDEAPDLQAMEQARQASQARMMNRVATQGVKYGLGAPGPAAGKKLVPHSSTDKKLLKANSVAPTMRDDQIPDLPTNFSSMGLDDETGNGTGDLVEESPDDGRIDGKTGMTIGQKRDIMKRVLGKDVKPPVPGRPNTLKG